MAHSLSPSSPASFGLFITPVIFLWQQQLVEKLTAENGLNFETDVFTRVNI